jgi:alpha-amylase
MYFSRGNLVIYYGDEQGFTGSGGDQVARQTMFASQVPDYLDDDLLGTDNTHAKDNLDTERRGPQQQRVAEDRSHPQLCRQRQIRQGVRVGTRTTQF